jgi:hypothetical protein
MRKSDAEALSRLLEEGGAAAGGDRSVPALAALAQALEASTPRPDEAFKSELRAMLVEEARAHTPATPGILPRVRSRWQNAVERTRYSTRLAAGGVATAFALSSGGGMALAAEHALPHQPLYGIKLVLDEARATLPFDRVVEGERHLANAEERIDEAERSVALAGGHSVSRALNASASSARKGAAALIRTYQDEGDEATVERLAEFAAVQSHRVELLAAQLQGEDAAAARDSLVVLERIEARLVAIGVCAPCGSVAAPRPGRAFDFSEIPPADQPFTPCPCEPDDTKPTTPARRDEPQDDRPEPSQPAPPREQPPGDDGEPDEPQPPAGPVPGLPEPLQDVDDIVNDVVGGIVEKGSKSAEKSPVSMPPVLETPLPSPPPTLPSVDELLP